MKKKIMKVSLLVFIGLFIFTSGVVAAKLSAKDIGFTSANEEWNVDNVEEAVNDLYSISQSNDNAYNRLYFAFYYLSGSTGYYPIFLDDAVNGTFEKVKELLHYNNGATYEDEYIKIYISDAHTLNFLFKKKGKIQVNSSELIEKNVDEIFTLPSAHSEVPIKVVF